MSLKPTQVEFFLVAMPLLAFILTIVFHIIVRQFYAKASLNIQFLVIFIFWGFAAESFLIYLWISKTIVLNTLDFFAICTGIAISYTGISFCYINILNIPASSIRIRILKTISESANGISETDLLKQYNDQDIANIRFLRLIEDGQIKKIGHGQISLGKFSQIGLSFICYVLRLIVLGRKPSTK